MILRLCCVVLAFWSVQLRAEEIALSSSDWQADLDFVVEQIVARHPHAFARIGEFEFRTAARDLRREIPHLAPEAIVVRMADLVARLQDGHTSLEPYVEVDAAGAFETWFPVRFRLFADGLFVTMAPAEQPDLVGVEVLCVGEVRAEEALRRAGTMVPAENDQWVTVNAPRHLSSGEALVGLGIIDRADSLRLTVRTRTGVERSVLLAGVAAPQSSAWFWRWLRGPVGTETVHGFDSLPVHLAQQVAGSPSYDFTYLPETRTLYLHLIGFWDAGDEDLLAFWERAWASSRAKR